MYENFIQTSIDYIEKNLFQDICLENCAGAAGYSLYHYSRIFRNTTGLTVMEYIRKRRISEAVIKMNETNEPLKEIAFSCGFNSQENFVRVFKGMFGILPTDYRKTKYSLHLFEKIILSNSFCDTAYEGVEEPDIITMEGFKVAGVTYYTTFENSQQFSDVPIFWNQYYAEKTYEDIVKNQSIHRTDYGVTIFTHTEDDLYDEANLRKNFRFKYLLGVKINEETMVSKKFDILEIPPQTYAVFKNPKSTEYDMIKNLIKTWNYIDFYWLPNSDYVHAGNYEFNQYSPYLDKLTRNIYIPISAKNQSTL